MIPGKAEPALPDNRYRDTFNATIGETLVQAIRIIGADPALVVPGTAILHHQKKAAAIRKRHEEDGLIVPPVMIVSITSRCNLACAGCYMHGRGHAPAREMDPATLARVAGEAAELGTSVLVLAGGEPLMRIGEITALAKARPQLLVAVFTNGLLIDEPAAAAIAACRNIVPVLSFEGFRSETDRRRGAGVYDRLLAAAGLLRARDVFFGCSVTTTRENFPRVTDASFVTEMLKAGARVFAYVEYVPMEPGTEGLVLTADQKKTLQAVLADFNRQFPALFLGFPGDEETYGGCLAAGRGFVHVSPSGDLEPCPAAPYSDANLAGMPLGQALQSRLLARLRDRPELLAETEGGCALRANRAWAEQIAGRR